MRIFRVGQTQSHRMRSILNGSRRYYIAPALVGALIFSPLILHTKADSFAGPGMYLIRSRLTGKALDIDLRLARGQDDGLKLIQWNYHGGSNQQFLIAPVCGGYYTIQARHSGKFLDVDVSRGTTVNGASLQQWKYTGGENQQFLIEPVGAPFFEGFYRIVARHSGKNLDVFNYNRDDGAQIVQWDDLRNGYNQQFSFTRIE